MLLIVNLSAKGGAFPVDALRQIDAVLAGAGFKKEVHSVVTPGRKFSITYDGPTTNKSRVDEVLMPVAEKNGIIFSVEFDESVKFP